MENNNFNNQNELNTVGADTIEVKKSKAHPILAGICDFLFLKTLVKVIFSFLESVLHIILNDAIHMGISIVLFILCISIPIYYYKNLSKRNNWLSPGEQIVGRMIIDGNKEWTNIYKTNRWGLFSISIISLLTLQFNFCIASYPIVLVLIKYVGIALVLYGLILIGQGKLRGTFLLIFAYLININIGIIFERASFLFQSNNAAYMLLIVSYPVISFIYFMIRKNKIDLPVNHSN